MKKILLTTIHRPLGVENETCTKNITAEAYHAQITLLQGPLGIRASRLGIGLDFIAANLKNPTTVLHYPTKRTLIKELKKGYDYIGISFIICTFPKAKELCELVRIHSPKTQIVLGGYGTVLKECDQLADHVCREEGVNYFRRLLGQEEVNTFNIPVITRGNEIMSVTTRPESIIPTGLGCSLGCDFCCTSHFFKRQYIPLIHTGRDIHKVMHSVNSGKTKLRNIGIIDEDFLADRKKIMEMAQLNAQEIEKPILFSCFATLKSLSQYTLEEFILMGLSGVWVGIESKRADYYKLKDIDAAQLISSLKSIGIIVLVSMIIGYDWHDEETIEEDFRYLLSLKPALSQIMIYSPCPQTPLHSKLLRENRLLNIPFKYHDGFHVLFRHPNFKPRELETLLLELIRREHEEFGPSIFRILEVQPAGYESLKDSSHPLFRARAREHQRLCLEIFPLLKLGIKKAPSQKVKEYLKNLRDRMESLFHVSILDKLKEFSVPTLYYYTDLKDRTNWLRQPKTEINRYNFSR